jgi:hypothetical protein
MVQTPVFSGAIIPVPSNEKACSALSGFFYFFIPLHPFNA